MTSVLGQFQEKNKLIFAYLAYLIMLVNSVSLTSIVIGILALTIFVVTIGTWFGKIYGGRLTTVNFLIGCFILLALSIVFLGLVVYFMIFSALFVWIFLALIPLSCYLLEKRFVIEKIKYEKDALAFNYSLRHLGVNATSVAKISIFVVTILFGSIVAWMGRTGNGISHIGQSVSYVFWPILVFSFFMVYLIWREEKLAIGLKLVSMFLAAFLVFSAPLLVYSNYVTEDSFGLLGVVRSIMQTGVYGWVPHLARTGYFAITLLPVVSSSSQPYIQIAYKLLTPLLVSIYVPLFIYLVIEKITRKKQTFLALISLFLFPTVIFLSVPLEKSVATIFFLGSLYFSFLLLDNATLRKAEILVLGLILLASPFLHDYFGLFAVIPLILSLFLRLTTIKRDKRSLFSLALVLGLTSLLIPSSFVLESYVSKSTTATIFSIPKLDSVISFWIPAFKLLQSSSLDAFAYLYSDNMMWIRYVVLIAGVLVLRKSTLMPKHEKTKIWLIATVLAFWLGYFLLKTSTLNPPENAKDYRFGLFADFSLIPLAAIALGELIETSRRITIQLRLPRTLRKSSSLHFISPQFTIAIILILVVVFSIYSGFNFDRIMERPVGAQGIGRYVVTDDKLEVMQYIQNMSGSRKSVVLTDSHMGQIAQGALTLNFSKAKLFNLNSGGALYSYFDIMKADPSRSVMDYLMNQTNSEIGFFVIGVNDWRGWQPAGAYWIDSNVIQELKQLANEWRVFGENNDMYVFVFQKT